MDKGVWLVLNFEFLPVCFENILNEDVIPKQVLEPKYVFNQNDGYNVFVDKKISVHSSFRLIALSKSTQWESNVYHKFCHVSVDLKKYQAEQEEELMLKRTGNKKDPRVILKELKFIEACFEGNVAIVKKFLLEGVDPNCSNEHGNTGLMEAALNGQK